MRIIPKNADAALRARGLRLTGPRRVVLDVLRSTGSHPTAEQVHRLVRRRLPRVSLGTVYRNLRLLVGEGLAAEIQGPHARFDANMEAHHHFTCLRCGRILDVDGPLAEPQAEALRGRIAARTGLAITHHRIEFFGRCQQCRSAKARPARSHRAR
jgi:Fur family transcriptional regulator, peroxide stress response regulator